jgi:hypothetical protein
MRLDALLMMRGEKIVALKVAILTREQKLLFIAALQIMLKGGNSGPGDFWFYVAVPGVRLAV